MIDNADKCLQSYFTFSDSGTWRSLWLPRGFMLSFKWMLLVCQTVSNSNSSNTLSNRFQYRIHHPRRGNCQIWKHLNLSFNSALSMIPSRVLPEISSYFCALSWFEVQSLQQVFCRHFDIISAIFADLLPAPVLRDCRMKIVIISVSFQASQIICHDFSGKILSFLWQCSSSLDVRRMSHQLSKMILLCQLPKCLHILRINVFAFPPLGFLLKNANVYHHLPASPHCKISRDEHVISYTQHLFTPLLSYFFTVPVYSNPFYHTLWIFSRLSFHIAFIAF